MTTRFFPPPHGEERKLSENTQNDATERSIRQWATPDRAASIAARSGILEASGPGDGPAVIGTELAGIDPMYGSAIREGMWVAREQNPNYDDDPLRNDVFDMTVNPGDLLGEIGGWWTRSPGNWLGSDAPIVSSAPVKTASRWFMMAADAGVDAVSDRVIRAGYDAVRETGGINYANPASYVEWGKEFIEEYAHGEDIGNKPLWGALGELTAGNRVNLGTGYVANSELLPEIQAELDEMAQLQAMNAQESQHLYDTDQQAWLDKYQTYQNPSQMATAASTRAMDAQMQASMQRSGPVTIDNYQDLSAQGQQQIAEFGRPITQQSMFKQEAFGGFFGRTIFDDPHGRQTYNQVSLGRVAGMMVSEPGTTPFHYVSGGTDFGKQIFADPLNYVGIGAVGKTNQARRVINTTTEAAARVEQTRKIAGDLDILAKGRQTDDLAGAFRRTEDIARETGVDFDELLEMRPSEATILLDSRARKTIEAGDANRWLTGEQAQPMVTALTEAKSMDEVAALMSNVKGKQSARLHSQLYDATSEGEVIDALLPFMGEMQMSGALRRSQGISTYKASDYIPFFGQEAYSDRLWTGIDKLTEAAFDRAYQVNQRGLARGLTPGGHMEMPTPGLSSRAQTRNMGGHTWAGRAFNNMSNAGIRTDDIDVGYAQLRRLARNYGIDGDTVFSRTSDGRIIKADDTEGLLAQLVDGEKLTGKTRSANDGYYRFAQTNHGNHSRAFDGVIEVMETAALRMEMDGIDPAFIKQVTSAVAEQGENSRFATNAIGEVSRYPGSGFMALGGDKPLMQPGPQLISEMYAGNINVPDAAVLRRTLAEKPNQFIRNVTGENVNVGLRRALNNFTSQKYSFDMNIRGDGPTFAWKPKGNLQERVVATYARRGIANIWKPMKLLRFGYIPKIVLGDEQGRMTAAGLSSMWAPGRIGQGDSPLAYITYLIGRKGSGDLAGNPLKRNSVEAAREFQDATSLRGNVYGEVGAMRSEHWGSAKWGTSQYEDGLATEWVQLAEDPIARNMMNPEMGEDVVAASRTWLLDGEGQQYLNIIADRIAQQNPFLAERIRTGGQELTNYLEMVNARMHLKTGGDYVWVDPDTGTLMNSMDLPYSGPDLGLGADARGVHVIRRGDDELLNGIGSGYIGEDAVTGGPRMSGLKPEDYEKLRSYAGRRIKEIDEANIPGDPASLRLPDGVKYEQTGYGHNNKGMAAKIIDTMMDYTVAKPAEFFNRIPAYRQFYWRNVGTMFPAMTDEAQQAALALARKNNVENLVLEQAQQARKVADGPIGQTIDDLDEASKYSHAFAAEATKDLLFDFAERKNFFDSISLISPFADAWLEAFTSWGRLFAQDPTKIRRPLKALEELRDDNPLEWGDAGQEQDVNNGFFHMNDYGKEVFTIPAPIASGIATAGEAVSTAVDVIPGVDTDFETSDLPEMEWEVSTESMNMIASQFYPAVGPVITIPAAGTIPTDTIGGQKLRDAISPFGLGESFGEELFRQTFGASPSLSRFLNAFQEGKFTSGEEERLFEQTKGWLMRDMLVSGEVTMEDLADPNKNARIQDELADRAQNVYLFRSAMQFMSPAAPFAPNMIADPDLPDDVKVTAIALQDGARAYYDIVEEFDGDHEKATLTFNTRYGFDPLPLLISQSRKEYDRATTEEAYQEQLDHPEFFEQFPATAYFLHPDDPADPFYYRAWSGQLGSDARDPKSVTEQMDEYVYRTAAARYDTFDKQISEELIKYNLEQKDYDAIRQLTLASYKNELIDEFSEYAAQVDTYSARKQQTTISELRSWGDYDAFKDDPTVGAVGEFFEAWDELEKTLKQLRGTTGVSVLPFKKTSSKYSDEPGKGQSWRDRHFVNSALLGIGDSIAAEEGNGEFATVWEQLIKPTIYDYEQDRPGAKEEDESTDELVERLLQEFG